MKSNIFSIVTLDPNSKPQSLKEMVSTRLKAIKEHWEGSIDSSANRENIKQDMHQLALEIESLTGHKPSWDLYLEPYCIHVAGQRISSSDAI